MSCLFVMTLKSPDATPRLGAESVPSDVNKQ